MIDINVVEENVNKLSKRLDSLNIDSIFIEQDSKLERIFYNEEQLHELRSCAKLLVSMAIGIAIEDKMLIDGIPLSLDTKIYPSIEKLVDIKKQNNLLKVQKWTVRNLLTHTTGYESQMMSERYIKNIDKNELLDYALNYKIPFDVGTRFAYNNVEPFVLSVFFQETFGVNLKDYINEKIFKKLNIEEFEWDNYGNYCPASTGLYLKHTDFHKIGQLLLNNGKYNEVQIIPENWVREMSSIQLETPTAYKSERVLPKIGVGYYTFISRDGYIFRDGSNGQYIIVNKEKNLLITIMSSEKDMKKITEIFRNII
ncbi:class C beta-lactamase-related serine hydrolase [bacterium c-19]|nr:class C beta-lactamase-related serine hydrolase [bacterium c-19]